MAVTDRPDSTWLHGLGPMGELMRDADWSRAPFGPPDAWPGDLRAAAALVCAAGFPALLVWGPELTVAAHNPAYLAILGRRSAALGRELFEAWPEARGGVESLIRAAAAGETAFLEAPLHIPDRDIWFRASFSPVRDAEGAPRGAMITGVESSVEQAQARELRARETSLRLALEAGRLAAWDWDLQTGAVTWFNPPPGALGYPAGDVPASYEAWLARIHPDDRPEVEAAIRVAREERRDFARRFRLQAADGRWLWISSRARFFHDPAGRPNRMVGVLEDITDRRRAEETQRLLLGELQHRTRNQLAVIRSIVGRTAEASVDLDDFRSHFEGRLNAFARTQAALTRSAQVAINLDALIREEVLAAAAADQVDIEGPDIDLSGKAAEAVSLALHELMTNAVKYGALTTPSGRIAITWRHAEGRTGSTLALEWRETGVPLLDVAPLHRGFGRRLIEEAMSYELGAEAEMVFAPGGLRVHIRIPLPPPQGPGLEPALEI